MHSPYFRAAALLFSLGISAPAFAHAHLVSATPAANKMAMSSAPTELRIKFSEGVELKFIKVKLTGPDMNVIKTGPAELDPGDNTLLIIPITAPLPDGDWQVASTDGHKTNDTYGFESMQ